jgi:hypothetical protein
MTARRHLTTEELLAAVDASPVASAAAHLSACPRCRAEIAHLRAYRGRRTRGDEGPGESALLRAYALLRPAGPRGVERRGFELPTLVYDSRTPELGTQGVRAAAGGRHLAWRAAAADVEVRWADTGGSSGGRLTGQVLPRGQRNPELAGDAWLEEPGRSAEWGLLDPSGEFTLPAPHGRKWRILLRWGALRLRLNP